MTRDVEMLTLQAQLAYSAARSDIETLCCPEGEWADGWHDPTTATDEDDQADVDRALRYLDLRGLIERHPTQQWVRVLEEDAPTSESAA